MDENTDSVHAQNIVNGDKPFWSPIKKGLLKESFLELTLFIRPARALLRDHSGRYPKPRQNHSL